MSTPKRVFKLIGQVTTGKLGAQRGELVIVDRGRLHEAQYRNKRDLDLSGKQSKQAKDDFRVPFAVVVDTKHTKDIFFPVYLEVEQKPDGSETPVRLIVNLHTHADERSKAPRNHRKK
jgi:hypothetical protein